MSALHSPRAVSPRVHRRRRHPRRVLVVALDAVVPERLADADVLVVAPALNSWLRHWLSDEDSARRRAEQRAAALVERLRSTAAHVEGRIGDADPLLAIADALATFPTDEIVIAALPEYSAATLDALLARARDLFPLHVVRTGNPLAIAA